MKEGETMSEQEKKARGKYTDFNKLEYDKQYQKENVYKIGYNAQRSTKTKERIEAAASAVGIKPSQYIRNAVESKLTADGYPAPSEETKEEDQ